MDLERVKRESARLSPWAHLATGGADGEPTSSPSTGRLGRSTTAQPCPRSRSILIANRPDLTDGALPAAALSHRPLAAGPPRHRRRRRSSGPSPHYDGGDQPR